ncbi:uncharacterized protein LOC120429249 [Culex pipiens pallens]|uniref:uncharacterized protein LOC120429249 n=1 Tax=Culex pipiens pallens TaxID=42434 RepID=UPI0019539DF7|nr:uncharacterized protein LOC120429249 [Culex pipiens pallens]
MEGITENAIYRPDFNDLPNELLWRIFRHLGHTDLLQMSLVCHRWNQTIFHFLNDRFRFRPEGCDDLHEHRTYKHLDLSACPLPLPTLNIKWRDYFFGDKTQLERQNGSHVRSIKVETACSHQDLLVRLLVTFKNLEKLDWFVSGKMLSYYKVTIGTRRMINASMAPVKHLKINAKMYKLQNVLENLSESLVTLDVVLSPQTLINICGNKNSFPNLETLKVEIDADDELLLEGSMKEFLETLPKLRKFSFHMSDPEAVQEVTDADTNIEEFELFGLVDYYVPDMSDMKNLKTFRTDGKMVHFYMDGSTLPMPQITTLDINHVTFVDIDALVEHFPNLTALRMASQPETNNDMLALVNSYPNLEHLAVRIQGPSFSTKLMLISSKLTKLVELHVNLVNPDGPENFQAEAIAKGNFIIFGCVLACLPNLRKFCITTDLIRDDTCPLASIDFPEMHAYDYCQVFVNGVLINQKA